MTGPNGGGTIPAMFRRNRKQQEGSAQADMPQSAPAPQSSGGYQTVELPTYHKGKRKVVIYRSDPSGKIIKTFKK